MSFQNYSQQLRRAASILALSVAVAAPGIAAAQVSVQMLDAATQTMGDVDSASMLDRAREAGSIRVIVGFETPAQPEGALSAAQVVDQRAAIASMQADAVAALGNPQVNHQYVTIPFSAMTVTPEQLQVLMTMPGVASIAEDVPEAPSLESSTLVIRADNVWRNGVTGYSWNVAVLDSGISYGHQAWYIRREANAAITTAACFSSNSPGDGATSLCRGGVTSEINRLRAAPACDINVTEGCGHGTHVAGTVMAHRPWTRRGVAFGSNVIPVQVFSMFDNVGYCGGANPCILSYTSDQVAALEYVASLATWRNIAAVNMSLGGGSYASFCDGAQSSRAAVINNLRSLGVATVIATGNNGYTSTIGAPACIQNAIAVGATDDFDNIASFSNQADGLVDLMAPGVSITAPFPGSRSATRTWQGTSMATPHVAGAFALLRSYRPTATVSEIETALECTAVPVTRPGTTGTFLRINVAAARRFMERGHTSC